MQKYSICGYKININILSKLKTKILLIHDFILIKIKIKRS